MERGNHERGREREMCVSSRRMKKKKSVRYYRDMGGIDRELNIRTNGVG